MRLPILHQHHRASNAELLRLFHQTQGHWCEHLGQPSALEVGTAYANPQLSCRDANHIRDVVLPPAMSPQSACELVHAHYARHKRRCAAWTLNPSAPPPQNQPLVEYLLAQGYRPRSLDILVARQGPPAAEAASPGLKIIPARAAYRQSQFLLEESARSPEAREPVEAMLMHLDDPHWEALLALKNGTPVAYVGVLSVGETGRLEHLYVAQAHRRQGLGRLMMGRAMELCARSLFRQVMLAVAPENRPAQTLFHHFGFAPLGPITSYCVGD